jgi:hypothetical protein
MRLEDRMKKRGVLQISYRQDSCRRPSGFYLVIGTNFQLTAATEVMMKCRASYRNTGFCLGQQRTRMLVLIWCGDAGSHSLANPLSLARHLTWCFLLLAIPQIVTVQWMSCHREPNMPAVTTVFVERRRIKNNWRRCWQMW